MEKGQEGMQTEAVTNRLEYLRKNLLIAASEGCLDPTEVDEYVRLTSPESAHDPRPDDMAELARLTAIELRKRGFFADYWHGHTITLPRYVNRGSNKTLRYLPICLDLSQFDNLGPIACADVIQAEESRLAREWAGDK